MDLHDWECDMQFRGPKHQLHANVTFSITFFSHWMVRKHDNYTNSESLEFQTYEIHCSVYSFVQKSPHNLVFLKNIARELLINERASNLVNQSKLSLHSKEFSTQRVNFMYLCFLLPLFIIEVGISAWKQMTSRNDTKLHFTTTSATCVKFFQLIYS